MVGPPGEGKTFVAVEMAMAVATGQECLGRRTKAGAVLYIAAEGATGMRDRVEAWLTHNGLVTAPEGDLPPVWFVTQPIQLQNEQPVFALEEWLKGLPVRPALIVIDTLAQCFGDGDENSATDMGRFVGNARRLQRSSGAAVVIIHHTTKTTNRRGQPRERGSGALHGAVDVMIFVSKKGDEITLENRKQKDAEPFTNFKARLVRVPLGEGKDGRLLGSCVLHDGGKPWW